MINRTAQQVLFRCSRVSFAGFSGKKHPPPYDWRDDHDMNPSFERDPRRIGCEDPTLYSYPYEGVQKEMPDLYPKEYDPKDLTKNFVGTYPMQPLEVTNLMEAPMQVLMDDIAHEREYGSQDLVFQPQTFKSQHFKKRGHDWMWVLACLTPIWLNILELIVNPDFEISNFKYQRPPPLDYEEEEYGDRFMNELFKSKEYKYLYDAGAVVAPYFQIIDNKKVYSKWAGVNQPGVMLP